MTGLNPQEQILAIYLMIMPLLQFSDMSEKQYYNSNIPSVIPKVASEKGRMYADLTPAWEVERLFLVDPRHKEKHFKASRKKEITGSLRSKKQ